MMEKRAGGRETGVDRRLRSTRIPHIPMEWMDPMSWRLPSGKDLAEFALQSGFLAPLMLDRPNLKRKTVPPMAPVGPVVESQVREAPEPSGSFRRIP
jgi:hypothetical protein